MSISLQIKPSNLNNELKKILIMQGVIASLHVKCHRGRGEIILSTRGTPTVYARKAIHTMRVIVQLAWESENRIPKIYVGAKCLQIKPSASKTNCILMEH